MTKSQFFHFLETMERGHKRIADVLEAHFHNQDRQFEERVLLAIKANKKKKRS